jgi:pilus assembly protein Flp/PilA
MLNAWNRFWNDESGQGLTEYALIIALVAVALIAVLIVFRNQIGGVFDRASAALNNAPGSAYPAVTP